MNIENITEHKTKYINSVLTVKGYLYVNSLKTTWYLHNKKDDFGDCIRINYIEHALQMRKILQKYLQIPDALSEGSEKVEIQGYLQEIEDELFLTDIDYLHIIRPTYHVYIQQQSFEQFVAEFKRENSFEGKLVRKLGDDHISFEYHSNQRLVIANETSFHNLKRVTGVGLYAGSVRDNLEFEHKSVIIGNIEREKLVAEMIIFVRNGCIYKIRSLH